MRVVRLLWRWTGAAVLVGALVALPALSAQGEAVRAVADTDEEPERLRVEVIDSYPHDAQAFTQGLELHGDLLYESTGRYGESDIRVVEPTSGEIEHRVDLPETDFGEGLTVVDDTVWQITWREETAFRRDADTLEEIERVSYTGEGWGLCHDHGRERLVMSDGSDELTFRDPETFEARGTTSVTLAGEPLGNINELECVDGKVWANVWLTDEIVRIDPETAQVDAVVDASGLLSESEEADADVLNGIAAVPDSDTFLITGKLWPWAFLVEFTPQAQGVSPLVER